MKSAAEYHEVTSYDRLKMEPHYMDWANQPRPYKTYPGQDAIKLPETMVFPETSLWDLARTSSRPERPVEFDLDTLAQIFTLNIIAAVVMVSGAVVISSQTTSVRASNLLASFIIVPMALLIQGESVVMFWGNFDALWLVALGLLVVAIILIRMGIKTFSREEILGREIDELNLRRSGRLFRHFFLAPPGQAAIVQDDALSDSPARHLLRWIGRVYRHDLPYLLRHNWMPMAVVVIMLVAAVALGWFYVGKFPLPQGVLSFENLSPEDFESLSDVGFLPALTTGSIFRHNVQALLLAGLGAVISLGVLAVLMLMVSIGLVGFFAGQVAWLGYSPLAFLGAFILPHGLFEIPAAVDAGFSVGDEVRVKNNHPEGHTRCPRYTRGRRGVIQKHHGVHHFQDDVDGDVGQQHLYTVTFTATELWGERGNPNDRIHAELWEYHLEAIT